MRELNSLKLDSNFRLLSNGSNNFAIESETLILSTHKIFPFKWIETVALPIELVARNRSLGSFINLLETHFLQTLSTFGHRANGPFSSMELANLGPQNSTTPFKLATELKGEREIKWAHSSGVGRRQANANVAWGQVRVAIRPQMDVVALKSRKQTLAFASQLAILARSQIRVWFCSYHNNVVGASQFAPDWAGSKQLASPQW